MIYGDIEIPMLLVRSHPILSSQRHLTAALCGSITNYTLRHVKTDWEKGLYLAVSMGENAQGMLSNLASE